MSKKLISRYISIFFILTVLLFSCNDAPSMPEVGKINISVNTEGINKTIAPNYDEIAIDEIKLFGKHANGKDSVVAIYDGSVIVLDNLVVGDWTFQAKAYNEKGMLIAESDASGVSINSNAAATLSLAIKYFEDGNGSLSLTIETDLSDTISKQARVRLTNKSTSVTNTHNASKSDSKYSFDISLSPGKYELEIEVLDGSGNRIGNSFKEILHIYKDMESTFSIPWKDSQFMKAASPQFSLDNSTTYLDGTELEIIAEDGSSIYYTTDGSVPSINSTEYASPIVLDKNMTVKAIAIVDGLLWSEVTSNTYNVKANAPVFSNKTIVNEEIFNLSLTSETDNATIYYTYGESSSPSSSWTRYSSPVVINDDFRVRAIAVKNGLENSDIVETNYVFVKGSGNVELVNPNQYEISLIYPSNYTEYYSQKNNSYTFSVNIAPSMDNVTYSWYLNGNLIENSNLSSISLGNGQTDLATIENYSNILSVVASNEKHTISEQFYLNFNPSYNTCPLIITEDGIISCNDKSITSIVIPTYINGIKVSGIGENAFSGCVALKSCIMPNSVTVIGDNAFNECTSLANIVIPDSVINIGAGAFERCSSLKSVRIPDSVTALGTGAFQGNTSLNSVSLGNGITEIKEASFKGCISLNNITGGENITVIGEQAFIGCALTELTISDFITSIGASAFSNCTELKSVYIGNGISTLESALFSGCTSLNTINIPSTVNNIEDDVFADCSALSLICIDKNRNTITSSPWGATSANVYWKNYPLNVSSAGVLTCDDKSSERLLIPSSWGSIEITAIGDNAFKDCIYLTEVVLPDSISTIGDSAFENCKSLSEITIPGNVSTVGNLAFSNCNALESISIPNSVTTIGGGVFYNCTNLHTVTIGSGITAFNEYDTFGFFGNCTSLESINIPSTVTKIGKYAFLGCSSLNMIVIPASVTSIGASAFASTNLDYIFIDNTLILSGGPWGASSATVCYRNSYLSVDYSGNVYSDSSSISGEIIIPPVINGKTVKGVDTEGFYGCSQLTSIILPEYITSIGEDAFYSCRNLQTVIIDENSPIKTISSYAFYNCSSLTNIELPNGLTSIGFYAFSGCSSLELVHIPDGCHIGRHAFKNCPARNSIELSSNQDFVCIGCSEGDESIIIPDGTKAIGNDAFYGCYYEHIIIPDSVVSIGNYAFSYSNFKEVTIPDSVVSIGNYAFSYSNFKEVTIPDSVVEIGLAVFYYSDVESVTIGSGIKSLKTHTYRDDGYVYVGFFDYCTSLTNITLNEGLKTIERDCFAYCSKLESITIPSTVTSIDNSAFLGCSRLGRIYVNKPKDTLSGSPWGCQNSSLKVIWEEE